MYTRRILHYSLGLADEPMVLSDRAIAGCWFEIHRRGGCGAGELTLKDEFPERDLVEIGDWIACEYEAGDRWYLGRVEHRSAFSPARVTLRLEGMGIQLNEVFPGGFGPTVGDLVPPHRYARTDLFPHDPDWLLETVDSVAEPDDVVHLLLQQYVTPRTDILYDPALIEPAPLTGELTSLKFRGEESARAIIKELAVRARNASWGVRADGKLFFLQPPAEVIATYREGRDLLSLEESRDREHLFNRLLLTGDYVYNAPDSSDGSHRGFYRWRGNYIQPASREEHGERRLRLWIPWIRTRQDSRQFVREFFRTYAQQTSRYLVEVGLQTMLPLPWNGLIRLEARNGSELVTGMVETIRVQFDHAPKFRLEIGPEDPRELWPEPPHDERWEVAGLHAAPGYGGDSITFTGTDLSSSRFASDFSSSDAITSETEISSDSSGTGSTASSASDSAGLSLSVLSSSVASDGSSEASDSDVGSEQTSSVPTTETNTGTTDLPPGGSSGSSNSDTSSSASDSDSSSTATGCCEESLPSTLTATLHGMAGCNCLDEVAFALHRTGDVWSGSTSLVECGRDITVILSCVGGGADGFRLELLFSDQCAGPWVDLMPEGTPICDPLDLDFAPPGTGPCCNGGEFQINITV